MTTLTVLVVSRHRPGPWIEVIECELGAYLVHASSRRTALLQASARCPEVVLVEGGPGERADVPIVAELRRRLPDAEILVALPHPSLALAVAAMRSGASDCQVMGGAARAALSRAVAAAETRRLVSAFRSDEVAGPRLVGRSPAVEDVLATLRRPGAADARTVLVEGESGTGKEVVARLLHLGSARAAGPLVSVNCSTLPTSVIESELFGHERGAFTSALTERPGLVEAAQGGTLFLDEIGDLPLTAQPKLLRLLEERKVRRLGGVEERGADIHVVAATSLDLEQRVRRGAFRLDLFHRLDLVRVRMAPLRERREDIPALAAWFIAELNRAMCRSVRGVSSTALALMQAHGWPGNVRELRNVMERAFVLYPEAAEIKPWHLPAGMGSGGSNAPLAEGSALQPLAEAERTAIVAAIDEARGNVARAARRLGLGRHALRYRMRRHGLAQDGRGRS